MEFLRVKFNGHKKPVIDVKSRKSDGLVVTCAEDKTIRLWDIRTAKSVRCITGFGEDPITALQFSSHDTSCIYGSTDSNIFTFDLRREGILLRDCHSVIYTVPASTESEPAEICCFDIHPKGGVNLLGIGDDDGIVTLIDTTNRAVVKRLSRVHSNLVGSMAFQPDRKNYLTTGGFDNLLCVWDYNRGRPASAALNFAEQPIDPLNASPSGSAQISNPPFVHALLYLQGGRHIACAVGDGSVRVVSSLGKLEGKSLSFYVTVFIKGIKFSLCFSYSVWTLYACTTPSYAIWQLHQIYLIL